MIDRATARLVAHQLVSLASARRAAVLVARAPGFEARISVNVSRVLSVVGSFSGTCLGDDLVRAGDVDTVAACEVEGGPGALVGERLVRAGVATAGAIELALRRQSRRRIADVFTHAPVTTEVVDGAPEPGQGVPGEPVCDAILHAMRIALDGVPVPEVRERMSLTRFGEKLLSDARLWPDEALLVLRLRASEDVSSVTRTVRAARLFAALQCVGALRPRESFEYTTLVRKRHEIASLATPSQLLELTSGARDSRKALRRLAGRLHPDRLGSDAPLGLRRAASDVLSALATAERQLVKRR